MLLLNLMWPILPVLNINLMKFKIYQIEQLIVDIRRYFYDKKELSKVFY